jgi:hypothetical protein
VALKGLQRIADRVRAITLIVSLSVVYILIITPMTLSRRNNPKRRLSSWMDNSESGWHANVQSTKDDATFSDSRSPSDELAQLREGYGNSALAVYSILKPLRWLARPPEEKELSTDLYVMF